MKKISLSHLRSYLSHQVNRVLPLTTKERSLMVGYLVDNKVPYCSFIVSYSCKQFCLSAVVQLELSSFLSSEFSGG